MPRKKTTAEFIKEAEDIHNKKYNYSLTKYKNNKTKVTIICPEHGVFEQARRFAQNTNPPGEIFLVYY